MMMIIRDYFDVSRVKIQIGFWNPQIIPFWALIIERFLIGHAHRCSWEFAVCHVRMSAWEWVHENMIYFQGLKFVMPYNIPLECMWQSIITDFTSEILYLFSRHTLSLSRTQDYCLWYWTWAWGMWPDSRITTFTPDHIGIYHHNLRKRNR